MAGIIGSLTVRIGADTAEFQSDMGKATAIANRETKRMAQSFDRVTGASRTAGSSTVNSFNRSTKAASRFNVEVQQSAGLLTKFAAASAGAFVGAQIVGSIVDATNKMIGYDQALQAATGSSQGAAEAFAFVRKETDRIGVSLEAGAASFAKLTAAARGTSLTTGDLRDIFTGINETARVLNLSAEDVAGAFRAIEQTISKGKVQAEELRGQLGERIPGAFQVAAQAMGLTSAELSKQMALGNIYADELIPKMVKRLHELYGAQAEVAAQTPSAQIERFRNALFELKNAVGEAGVLGAVAGGAEVAADAFTAIAKHLDAIKVAAVAAGAALTTKFVAGLVDSAKAAKSAEIASLRRNMIDTRYAVVAASKAQRRAEGQLALAIERTNAGSLRANNARRKLIATTEALAVADRQAAAARLANAAGPASLGKRIGGGALALVGGGAGLAVAGAAAAVYGLIKAVDHYTDIADEMYAASVKSAKSTRDLADSVIAAKNAIQEFNKTGETQTSYESIIDSRAEAEERLSVLNDKLIKQEKELSDASVSLGAHSLTTSGILNDVSGVIVNLLNPAYKAMQFEIEATREEIKLLEKSANIDWEDAFNIRQAELAAERAGSAFNKLISSFLEAKEQATTPSGAVDFADKIAEEYDKINGKAKTLVEQAKEARDAFIGSAEFASGMNADNASIESLQKQAEAIDKWNETIAKAAEIDAARASKAPTFGGGGVDNSAEEAADKQAQAYEKLQETLEKQQVALGLITPQQAAYNETLRAAGALVESLVEDGVARADAEVVMSQALMVATEARAAANAQMEAQAAAMAREADIVGRMKAEIGDTKPWQSMTRAQQIVARTVADVVREYRRLSEAGKDLPKSLEQYVAEARTLGESLALDDILAQFDQPTMFEGLIDQINRVDEAIAKAKDGAEEFADVDIGKLEEAAKLLRIEMGQKMLGVVSESLRGIQSMTEEGSSSYKKLQVAIDAVTLAEAVLAVIHQASQGDVYSAIPRMIAMIAAIQQLGVSVGSVGGGNVDATAQRQATQGTGTVLGDPTAKSESIQNAVEITAKATSQLPAINRGMLNAIKGVEAGIDGVTASIAGMEFDFQHNIDTSIGFWEDVFGGSVVSDSGLQIAGGKIADLIDSVFVQAFEEVTVDEGLFGGTDTSNSLQSLGDSANAQFSLILQSIVDSVEEAAKALGLLPADIQAAIEQFQVASQKISLEGLTGEEKNAALKAVFSTIFDNLAAAVVPFVEQFQKVGEGLGETLVRVATDVQVMQEAVRQMGLTLDVADPERFAQISVGLIELVGGVEKFISGMQSFVDKFAPESFKFQSSVDTINMAFSQVGLTVPMTREGMWALAQSLDLTTEAGREQMATILRLADVSDQYYDMLESRAKAQFDYAALSAGLQGEAGLNPLAQSILEIAKWSQDTRQKLQDLAKAAGMAGAKESDLALVHTIAARRAQAAIAALYESSQALVDQLYGTGSVAEDASSSVRNFGSAMGQAAQDATDAINLLLGNLSPFSDRKKLDIALQGQLAGTVTPQQVLEIGRRLFSSGADYRSLFERVMAIGDRTQRGTTGSGFGGSKAINDIAEKTLSKAERFQLADQLANNIADLSAAQEISFQDVADKLGLNLESLGRDLGLDNQALSDYLSVLASDNFGLMDLQGVLASEVDRLIAAITGTPLPEPAEPETGPQSAFNPNVQDSPTLMAADQTATQNQALREEVAVMREQLAVLLERIADNTRDGARATDNLADSIGDSELVKRTVYRRGPEMV